MHLVVLQHGLWGTAQNLGFLQGLLDKTVQEKSLPVVVLNSSVNELYLTYEGFDACGDRLFDLINTTCQEHRQKGTPITHLSLVGYSMGGLIVRYVVGKLFVEGLLVVPGEKPASKDALVPVNFVTIATPHLGSWVQPTSWFVRTFNSMVPRIAARAGTQFMMIDRHAFGRPILVNMTDPELPFMRGLKTFRHHMLLANTLHDRTVPYCTAAVCEVNPYETQDARPIDPKYPSIVRPVPRPTASAGRCSRRQTGPATPEPAGAGTDVTYAVGAAAEVTQTAAASGAVGGEGDGGTPAGCEVPQGSPQPRETTESDEELQQWHKRRARKGLVVRIVFLALFPITIPLAMGLFGYLVMVGRRQWRAVADRTFDHTWVEDATPASASIRAHRSNNTTSNTPSLSDALAQKPSEARLEQGVGSEGIQVEVERPQQLGQQAGDASGRSAGAGEGIGSPASGGGEGSGEDSWLLVGASLEKRPRDVLTSFLASAAAVPAPQVHSLVTEEGETQGGYSRVEVSLDGTRELYVLDGLVDTAGREREAQLWMIKQLNKLPWNKVDVDTRHYHAHAAIVLRNPERFMANADCMQYLADHLKLDITNT